jgi:hypothetical protein
MKFWAGGVAQVVELLPSKREPLSSNASNWGKKNAVSKGSAEFKSQRKE